MCVRVTCAHTSVCRFPPPVGTFLFPPPVCRFPPLVRTMRTDNASFYLSYPYMLEESAEHRRTDTKQGRSVSRFNPPRVWEEKNSQQSMHQPHTQTGGTVTRAYRASSQGHNRPSASHCPPRLHTHPPLATSHTSSFGACARSDSRGSMRGSFPPVPAGP